MPPPPNLAARVDFNPGSARAWAAGWDYSSARIAVDEHLRGRFSASYQLAIDLSRHPAALAARRQRRSAIAALPWLLTGPERAPGRHETEAAVRTWSQIRALLGEITDDLAVMGLAVLEHPLEIVETETGPRYVVGEVRHWPLAAVEYGAAMLARDGQTSAYAPDRYYARAADGTYHVLPRPGETDLHWTVIGEGAAPHRRGAIVACDLEYVQAQMARRAWAKLQVALGKASVVGEMPADVPMSDTRADNTVGESAIASDMLALVSALGETQVAGIHPHGARVYPVQVAATTADLLPQSIDASCRMFALALLGHDGGVTRGTAVYNDPRAQSVPEDLARDDERVIARAVTALLSRVAQLNCARCAPIVVSGQIPDSDQDMRRESVQKRRAADDAHRAALVDAGAKAAALLAAERAAGLRVDDARVAEVYALAGIAAPALAPAQSAGGQDVFAYDLDNGVVTINEQRATKGKPPVAWGNITTLEARIRIAAGWSTSGEGWIPPREAPPAKEPAPSSTPPAVA